MVDSRLARDSRLTWARGWLSNRDNVNSPSGVLRRMCLLNMDDTSTKTFRNAQVKQYLVRKNFNSYHSGSTLLKLCMIRGCIYAPHSRLVVFTGLFNRFDNNMCL